jgi:hypothetical protein
MLNGLTLLNIFIQLLCDISVITTWITSESSNHLTCDQHCPIMSDDVGLVWMGRYPHLAYLAPTKRWPKATWGLLNILRPIVGRTQRPRLYICPRPPVTSLYNKPGSPVGRGLRYSDITKGERTTTTAALHKLKSIPPQSFSKPRNSYSTIIKNGIIGCMFNFCQRACIYIVAFFATVNLVRSKITVWKFVI